MYHDSLSELFCYIFNWLSKCWDVGPYLKLVWEFRVNIATSIFYKMSSNWNTWQLFHTIDQKFLYRTVLSASTESKKKVRPTLFLQGLVSQFLLPSFSPSCNIFSACFAILPQTVYKWVPYNEGNVCMFRWYFNKSHFITS